MQYQTYLAHLEKQAREKELKHFLDTLAIRGVDDVTKEHLEKYNVTAIDIHDDPSEFYEYLSACTRRIPDFPYGYKDVLDVKYLDELNYPIIEKANAFDVTKTHLLLRQFVDESKSYWEKNKHCILHVYPAISIENNSND